MHLHRIIGALAAVAVVLSTAAVSAQPVAFAVDPVHSSVAFSARHMVISNVKGAFDRVQGTITYDARNMAASSVEVTIETASVNTKNEDRDKHLRSDAFFDVEKFPAITFKSTKVERKGDGWVATGDLTIRDVTRSIEVPFQLNGPIKNPWGMTVIGIDVAPITINRQDFGVSWNKALDNGGVVVGDNIKVELQVEATSK